MHILNGMFLILFQGAYILIFIVNIVSVYLNRTLVYCNYFNVRVLLYALFNEYINASVFVLTVVTITITEYTNCRNWRKSTERLLKGTLGKVSTYAMLRFVFDVCYNRLVHFHYTIFERSMLFVFIFQLYFIIDINDISIIIMYITLSCFPNVHHCKWRGRGHGDITI